MHEGSGRNLLSAYLLVSLFLCFLLPAAKTRRIKNFIEYVYYVPYAGSSQALERLAGMPGRLFALARLDENFRRLRRENAGKDFKIKMLEADRQRLRQLLPFAKDPQWLEGKPEPTTVYGALGTNSNALLLKNRGFSKGQPVAARIRGRWVLVGIIKNILSSGVAVCMLTTDESSSISVAGAGGGFWAVMKGAGAGGEILDFIWPSIQTKVEKGEELVTSGWDGKFPPGLLCGSVRKISRDRAGEIFVSAVASYNANSLSRVFVMRNK